MNTTIKNKENLELGISEYHDNISAVIPVKRDISWIIFKLIVFTLVLVIVVTFILLLTYEGDFGSCGTNKQCEIVYQIFTWSIVILVGPPTLWMAYDKTKAHCRVEMGDF